MEIQQSGFPYRSAIGGCVSCQLERIGDSFHSAMDEGGRPLNDGSYQYPQIEKDQVVSKETGWEKICIQRHSLMIFKAWYRRNTAIRGVVFLMPWEWMLSLRILVKWKLWKWPSRQELISWCQRPFAVSRSDPDWYHCQCVGRCSYWWHFRRTANESVRQVLTLKEKH